MTTIKLSLVALLVSVACSSSGEPADQSLVLPGTMFYPESLSSTADGTLFVGSFGTGKVIKVAPGTTSPVDFVTTADIKQAAGVLVDEATGYLWVCADDTSNTTPSSLRGFDLASGAARATHAFPRPAFCNDMTVDGDHNLYVADSLGAVYRLARGGGSLEPWSTDPLLTASVPMGFGANGIAWDLGHNIYVNTFSDNRLLRIAINADGTAGSAVALTVTPPLSGPDGMRTLDPSTLLIAEQAGGRLTKVSTTDGRAQVIMAGLDTPTSVTLARGSLWVVEGLGHLLDPSTGPPPLPFEVRSLPAP